MQSPVISAHLLIKPLLCALVGVEDGWRVKSKPAAEQGRKRRGRGLQEVGSRGRASTISAVSHYDLGDSSR